MRQIGSSMGRGFGAFLECSLRWHGWGAELQENWGVGPRVSRPYSNICDPLTQTGIDGEVVSGSWGVCALSAGRACMVKAERLHRRALGNSTGESGWAHVGVEADDPRRMCFGARFLDAL